MRERPKIIYDNKCGFCTGTKGVFDKLDKKDKIDWVGIDNFNNKKYNIKKDDLLKEMHLLKGGRVKKGYYAFKEVSREIPWFYPLYVVSLIPGVDFIGSRVYRLIAKHRYKL